LLVGLEEVPQKVVVVAQADYLLALFHLLPELYIQLLLVLVELLELQTPPKIRGVTEQIHLLQV
jgi:hypothetical protein